VQPKIQYCAAKIGGCGKKIQRGGTCKCGRRHLWRWRSLPTIITVQKLAFEAMGLRELLEAQQAQRYADDQAGKVGPEPERDIRRERDQRRRIRAQHRRTSAAGIESRHDPELAVSQEERLARLYREKKRE
jgi:hypothetical protein